MTQKSIHQAEFEGTVKYIQSNDSKTVVVDDAAAVFEGDYLRVGRDLQITGPDGTVYKIIDYFAHGEPPALLTTTGASLSGAAVEALAGPQFVAQYAQAAKSAAAAGQTLNIGKVQTINGEATAQRKDGTVVKLKIDELVYQGDVIQTANGAKVSITFKDGSIFAVSESARMVLDKMVYDPSGSSNSMLFNLIQGTFSFIAGKIASTGKMEVETPVATMGIRGTTVVASVEAVTGETRFSLVNDPDGTSGAFSIFNKRTGQLIGSVSTTTNSLLVRSINTAPIEVPRDAAAEKSAVDQIYRAYQDFQRRGSLEEQDQNQDQNKDDQQKTQKADNTDGSGDTQKAENTESTENVQQASVDATSSGLGQSETSSDPLTNLQTASVSDVAPLGGTNTNNDLPEPSSQTITQSNAPEPEAEAPPPVVEQASAPPSPPVLQIPGFSLAVAEDGSAIVSGFGLAADSNDPIAVTISAQSTVTLASTIGLEFTVGDGVDDEVLQFTGAPQDIVNALNGLSYFPTPNNDGDGGLTITLDDGNFVVSATLNVAISPLPDAPIAIDDTFTATEGTLLFGDVFANNGSGVDYDPDQGDSFTVTEINGSAAAIGVETQLASGAAVTAQSDGTFSFSPADSVAEGEVVTDSFTYTIEDTTGRTGTATVDVVVTGVNDAPVVSAVTNPAAVPEGDTGVLSNVSFDLTNYFTASDVDNGETPVIDTGSIVIAANASSDTTLISPFVVFPANPTTVVVDTANYDFLNAGESAIVDVTFDVVSGVDRVSRTVQLTVTGVNDASVIAGNATGSVTEDVGVVPTDLITTSGALTITDVDTGQEFFQAQGSTAGSNGYGTFTLATNGAWTYTADTTQAAIQQLGVTDTLTDSFTAVSADSSASQLVTVTINGTNDIPVIGGTTTGSVTEDVGIVPTNLITTSGALTITDIDTGQASFLAQNSTAGSNGYGTFTLATNGTWTYAADTTQAAIQQLSATDTLTDSFTAVSADGSAGQLVTVTINGTNDIAVIGGTTTGSVTEDAIAAPSLLITNGALTISDDDTGQASFQAQGGTAGSNGYGTFTLATNGSWTYQADNAQAAIQQLGVTDTLTDSFTAVSADGSASQLVTVTINGNNDGPTLVSTATVVNETLAFEGTKSGDSYSEGAFTLSLQDLINSPAFSLVNIGGDGDQEVQLNSSIVNEGYVLTRTDGGTFSFNGVTVEQNSGSVTFRDAAGNQSSHGGGTLSFPTAYNDTTSLTIYANAVLDDILISYGPSNNAGAVTELLDGAAGENTANLTASGSIAFNDIDLNDTHTGNFTAQGGNYLGSFAVVVGDAATGDGAGRLDWTFTVNDGALDYLADGQVVTQLYDVSVNDGTSSSSTETVTVTITGENDAPVISTLANTTDNFSSLPAFSTLPSNFAGFNWANANRWFTFSGVELRTQDNAPPNLEMDRGGEYFVFNSIDVRVNGNTYTAKLEGYRDGALVAQETFTITTSYSPAAFSTDVLVDSVRITEYRGPQPSNVLKNDGVDFFIDNFSYGLLTPLGAGAGPATGAVTELPDGDAGENTANLTATGSIVFTDSETSDNHTVNFTPQAGGYIGTFAPVLADPSNGDGLGRIDWTFTINDAALDSLESFRIKLRYSRCF